MKHLASAMAGPPFGRRRPMIRCDDETCGKEAIYSLIFRAADGSPLSKRWNRCEKHAFASLPEIAPFGSIVELSGPREVD